MPFIDTRQLKVKEPRPGWKARYFHSANMTFAHYAIVAGASIHEHSHPQEEVWNVIEGELEITVAGQTQIAGPGTAIIVPPNTAHSVKALSDGWSIIVDYPLRDSVGGVSTDLPQP